MFSATSHFFYPCGESHGFEMRIDFRLGSREARRVTVRLTLDFDLYGSVVGIEILNLKEQGGNDLLDGWSASIEALPRWSYDPDVDAFYLRLADARSADQRTTEGALLLDECGRLVGLNIATEK